MSQDGWHRIHQLAEEKIRSEGLTLARFYELTGISDGTWRTKIVTGVGLTRADKIVAFEDGMGWVRGSVALVLAGADPIILETEPAALPDSTPDVGDLVAAVRQAIADGEERSAKMDTVTAVMGHLMSVVTSMSDDLAALLEAAKKQQDQVNEVHRFVERREAALSRRPGELD